VAITRTTAEILPRPLTPFPARHPSDHNFFLAYVALIWFAVLAGFVPDVVRHLRTHAAPYPIAVHVHAAVSVAWSALLTSQVLLMWTRRRIHPAWVMGALWVLAGQWTASWLYCDPTCKAVATSILRMWVS